MGTCYDRGEEVLMKMFLQTYWWMIAFVIAVLILIFTNAVRVSAHHPSVDQYGNCDGWKIVGNYIGGNLTKRLEWDVTYTTNGFTNNVVGNWEGQSNGFEVFKIQGADSNIIATGYLKQFKKVGQQWVLEQQEDIALSFNGQCTSPTVIPTNTPTVSVTTTPSATPSLSPTATFYVTSTMTPTLTPSYTITSTPVPGPTATPQPGPTATPRPPEPQTTPKGLEKGVQYGNK